MIGPADLQLHARSPDGFDERVLSRVEHMPGVEQAAPLLEQTATASAPMVAAQRSMWPVPISVWLCSMA